MKTEQPGMKERYPNSHQDEDDNDEEDTSLIMKPVKQTPKVDMTLFHNRVFMKLHYFCQWFTCHKKPTKPEVYVRMLLLLFDLFFFFAYLLSLSLLLFQRAVFIFYLFNQILTLEIFIQFSLFCCLKTYIYCLLE